MIWVWMENHRGAQVLGKPTTPYETGLSQQFGQATNYRSIGYPSLPNYLGATSGDTWGVTNNGGPTTHVIDADNLFRQIRASGRRGASYLESMPANCSLVSKGRYALKHNPATYYQGPGDREACQRDNVPLGTTASGLFHDALREDTLPAFSFVKPDLCHDTHDCSIATGDRWLAEFLPTLFTSPAYLAGGTAVFLVWDEPSPMPFVVIAPTVPVGSVLEQTVDHYSLLSPV